VTTTPTPAAGDPLTGLRGPNAGAGPPAGLADIAKRVEHRLATLLDAERARWSQLDPDMAEPLDRLTDAVLAGGKRLRPAFVHWGFAGAADSVEDDTVVDAGAAFEMLHTFALIHDDVVDDSDTRRGLPAMHTRFGAIHAAGGYRGESSRFGEGVAVLVGDLAHVYADVLTAAFGPAARRVWDELRIELNVGQYLDVLGSARGDTDPVRAARIARYKSAKYTIERPLHLGAALAGRLSELAGAYTAYGVPLGEAFQLRDDVLGVFGDQAVTGKPVGDDLREGKPTPLLALAVARARPDERDVLARVGSPDLDEDDIARCQQVLVDTGAVAEIEAEIERRRAGAVGVIATAPIGEPARSALVELAWYVTARDR
jgi:geranylgeranyl diphosphate synthase type I